ncbi:MAG: phosphatase PAP2 family protein [Candidatus Eremiobacteraeota bacterium]|nr:phosphatase PAP2 family protein [Candidatus Eremiobacteraeota bacterium]
MFVQWERALDNHSDLVAWWFTWCCYMYVLGPLCLGLLVLAIASRAWRARALASVCTVLIGWAASDLTQRYFMRPRRLDWFVKHETAFSFPSTHATLAVAFYFLWAILLFRSRLPNWLRYGGFGVLTVLSLGICWSRLALGAHYLTDLFGGALLGLALIAVALSLAKVVAIPEPSR